MNNQPPFLLLKENRNEFINKKCAICLCALFYPEVGDDFVSCSRLRCAHMFHTSCIDRITKHECPECRQAIITKKVIIDKSIELAIRLEAFNGGHINAELRENFKCESIILKKYPYHAIVFEKWQNKSTKFS